MEQARKELKKLNVFVSNGSSLNRCRGFADYDIRQARAAD
jgi:hypothetical protein